jgi:thioredoxin reductase (NADPH)
MHQQALRYGLETINAEVTGLAPEQPYRILTTEHSFKAKAIIIAAGSEYRKLGVAGEERLLGRGVSYCATCDGFFFRDQEVAVIGGGDAAITDALELSQQAHKVYVIHRRDQLRATQVLQQRAFAEPKIEFIWDTIVEEIVGPERVKALKLRNLKTHQLSSLEVAGIFVAVGLKPNSQCFANIVELNETGHIVTNELMATSVPGILAAGDIRRNSARQIATAVGDGATAAMSVFRYLRG